MYVQDLYNLKKLNIYSFLCVYNCICGYAWGYISLCAKPTISKYAYMWRWLEFFLNLRPHGLTDVVEAIVRVHTLWP